MSAISVSTPSITVNNVVIGIKPNSFSYTEGFGEQSIRVQSAGGGTVEQVYSQDATSKYSMVKFIIYNTPLNIENARAWKSNLNNNAISITDDNGITRHFNRMALINNYEVKLSADGEIELEFHGSAAV